MLPYTWGELYPLYILRFIDIKAHHTSYIISIYSTLSNCTYTSSQLLHFSWICYVIQFPLTKQRHCNIIVFLYKKIRHVTLVVVDNQNDIDIETLWKQERKTI